MECGLFFVSKRTSPGPWHLSRKLPASYTALNAIRLFVSINASLPAFSVPPCAIVPERGRTSGRAERHRAPVHGRHRNVVWRRGVAGVQSNPVKTQSQRKGSQHGGHSKQHRARLHRVRQHGPGDGAGPREFGRALRRVRILCVCIVL